MQLHRLAVAFLIVLLWAVNTLLPEPQQGPFLKEELRIPGADARHMLAITVLRPRGSGPFGAVILNHGTAATEAARSRESAALFMHTAAAFAQRDYAVFMPLRRGFGATGGMFAEDTGPCASPDFARGEAAAAADVLAAYQFARGLPYVDGSRMILAGQSAGGMAALYAAAKRPEGLAAVLAFAAGRGADPQHPGVPCALEPLAALFAELGHEVRAPVLLHYAQNDLAFGPAASLLWFKRFTAAGGRAEYVLQPPFGADGHGLFSHEGGVERWLPEVERFLLRHGIPFDAPRQRI